MRLAVPPAMVILLDVFGVPAPEAVKVCTPAVTRVVAKMVVPEVKGKLPGAAAYGSVIPGVSGSLPRMGCYPAEPAGISMIVASA